MESFYFVMDLACWLKPRKMEKHFCNDMNMMDGKHNQQFWLRSTISQCSIWSLRVPSFLCSSGISVCAAAQMQSSMCPAVVLPESQRRRGAPGMYGRSLSLFCPLWKEGLVAGMCFSGCGGDINLKPWLRNGPFMQGKPNKKNLKH